MSARLLLLGVPLCVVYTVHHVEHQHSLMCVDVPYKITEFTPMKCPQVLRDDDYEF